MDELKKYMRYVQLLPTMFRTIQVLVQSVQQLASDQGVQPAEAKDLEDCNRRLRDIPDLPEG